MAAAMAVSLRTVTDTAQGLAVEPGREEPTLKVGRRVERGGGGSGGSDETEKGRVMRVARVRK